MEDCHGDEGLGVEKPSPNHPESTMGITKKNMSFFNFLSL